VPGPQWQQQAERQAPSGSSRQAGRQLSNRLRPCPALRQTTPGSDPQWWQAAQHQAPSGGREARSQAPSGGIRQPGPSAARGSSEEEHGVEDAVVQLAQLLLAEVRGRVAARRDAALHVAPVPLEHHARLLSGEVGVVRGGRVRHAPAHGGGGCQPGKAAVAAGWGTSGGRRLIVLSRQCNDSNECSGTVRGEERGVRAGGGGPVRMVQFVGLLDLSSCSSVMLELQHREAATLRCHMALPRCLHQAQPLHGASRAADAEGGLEGAPGAHSQQCRCRDEAASGAIAWV
jgi:hypothetical protein